MRPLFSSPTNNAARPALQTMLLVGVESISLLPSGRLHQLQQRHQHLHRPQRQLLRSRPRPVLHQQPLQRLRPDQHPLHGRTQHRGRDLHRCRAPKETVINYRLWDQKLARSRELAWRFWGAVAAATWFEKPGRRFASVAAVSRQHELSERITTDSEFSEREKSAMARTPSPARGTRALPKSAGTLRPRRRRWIDSISPLAHASD